MRAYFIRVTAKGDPSKVLALYTSFNPDGTTNGRALQVEFDIPVSNFGDLVAGANLKIYGVNFADITAAANLNDADITVYGGMAKGLPLANPAQAGIIMSGSIFQCWGNWQGREISLEMVVYAKGGTNDAPVNLSFTWLKGVTLGDAVTQALKIAYPGAPVTGSFSPSLVYTEDQPFAYKTLSQFCAKVQEVSKVIIPDPAYIGAQIVQQGAGFRLYDGTVKPAPKYISYLDFIGQPTWLDAGTMQFRTVLRADLNVGDTVQLPRTSNVINTAASLSRFRDTGAFQGVFTIRNIRHIGSSRQTNAEAWMTVCDCYAGT